MINIESIEWISLKDAVPPFLKGVLITNGKEVSFGRIYEIQVVHKPDNFDDQSASYKWKSIKPEIFDPTHWMPLPTLEKNKP